MITKLHKPNETTINLFIDKLDKSGIGISLMQNEDVYLIPYSLPGETVKASIINKFKSKVYCSSLKILENSSERSKNTCNHFSKCGGCLLQHWKYENYKNLNVNFIEFTELKIKQNNNYYSVKIIFDKNISSFVDNNFYLLQDKSEIFLVHLSKDKSENSQSSKIIVRPYDTNFRPFRIYSKSLVIHSKVIFLGSLETFDHQNE